jgi:hypothetical protein
VTIGTEASALRAHTVIAEHLGERSRQPHIVPTGLAFHHPQTQDLNNSYRIRPLELL